MQDFDLGVILFLDSTGLGFSLILGIKGGKSLEFNISWEMFGKWVEGASRTLEPNPIIFQQTTKGDI